RRPLSCYKSIHPTTIISQMRSPPCMAQILYTLTRQMKRRRRIALRQIKIIRITHTRRQFVPYNVDRLRNVKMKRLNYLRKPIINVPRTTDRRVTQPINTRKRTKIIVETMIFLNYEYDVLKLRR